MVSILLAVVVSGGATAQGDYGPAEVPPETFSGTQYVDSQGCLFVRASIDGVTTWVPRVNQARQPICGFRPTYASTTPAPPAQSLPIPPAAPDPVPAPEVTVSAPPPAPAPSRRATRTPSRVQATQTTQQANATRYIPKHVYEQRAGSADIKVPKGYVAVWNDGRLNPNRAITTDAPAKERAATVPPGYRAVFTDGRLNQKRGIGTETGAARMAQVWSNDVPRRLVPAPVNQPVADVTGRVLQSPDTLVRAKAEAHAAQPAAQSKPSYIRAAAYGTEAEAREAARQLALASGLPAKAGFVRKGGSQYPAVLVGPFPSSASAKSALAAVRQAGFSKAKVLR